MRVTVNGLRLFFDVEGSSLRPEGERMVAKPTLVLLHGGPGADHSLYKPDLSALSDVAQVVFLDHRGNGRSDHGPRESWTIAQWADDVRDFCDALGIERPIVYGASFGGIVAMAYATRHPAHSAKLVLVSTSAQGAAHAPAKVAMFGRLGGPAVEELARRRFVDGDTSPELLRTWREVALPFYTRSTRDALATTRRIVLNPDAVEWFNRPGGEGRKFDLLADLQRIACPTLLLGGLLDPMTPIECQRDIAAAIRPELLTYREFEDCGHAVVPDVPAQALALVRDFIRQ